MSIAAGDLVMVDAYGDHRRPAAFHLYVVMGMFHEAGPVTTSYRVRPVNRNGHHSKDKVVRVTELTPLADYGMRIKFLNREHGWMTLEPHGVPLPGRAWNTPGYPPGADRFTQVDRSALAFINWQGPQGVDRE